MNRAARILATVAVLLGGAGQVKAGFVNAGFETGNFTGWQTAGDTSVQGTIFGINPVGGSYQALLTTLPSGSGDALQSYSGTPSASASALNAFLGATLPANAAGPATEGSAIKQTVTLTAGESISFWYNYLTNEDAGSGHDYSFVSINGSITTLADSASTLVPATPDGNGNFSQQTKYQQFTLIAPTAGSYTIGVGVVDTGDTFGNSGLLVDNFAPPAAAVPAPSGLALFASAILPGLGYVGWRRRKQPAAA